jgi:integrase
MSVILRQRFKAQKISLYLDIYSKGHRSYEYLHLYLHPEINGHKLPTHYKEENQKTLQLAETLRSKRHWEIESNTKGIQLTVQKNTDFITYVQKIANSKTSSTGSYDTWQSSLKHLINFTGNNFNFNKLSVQWLEDFKTYLKQTISSKNGHVLFTNSQASYFSCIKSVLKRAWKEQLINKDLANLVCGIPIKNTHREYLTIEEIKKLAKAKCDIPILKQAFLFAVLTGLRFSDIKNLSWKDIKYEKKTGYVLQIKTQKTSNFETINISNEAFELLEPSTTKDHKVFKGLNYSPWANIKLSQWILRAGITKTITFHCARHTFATLQIAAGTDIYTVSKMLGHQNIKATQVYAKLVDDKKIKAAGKITLK